MLSPTRRGSGQGTTPAMQIEHRISHLSDNEAIKICSFVYTDLQFPNQIKEARLTKTVYHRAHYQLHDGWYKAVDGPQEVYSIYQEEGKSRSAVTTSTTIKQAKLEPPTSKPV